MLAVLQHLERLVCTQSVYLQQLKQHVAILPQGHVFCCGSAGHAGLTLYADVCVCTNSGEYRDERRFADFVPMEHYDCASVCKRQRIGKTIFDQFENYT